MSIIRILLADDHQMFRTGIANLLKKEADFDIVGEAGDGLEACRLALQLKPDVIIMDVSLPFLDGISATKQIISDDPSSRILVLTSYENEDFVIGMVKAGAKGYLLKDAPLEELVLAIKTISKGSSYFAKEITPILFAHLNYAGHPPSGKWADLKTLLTEREWEVLKCIAGEQTNREIAARLYISPRTVETHRRNLIHKLKVKNTAGLVKFYLLVMEKEGEAEMR